MIHRFRKYFVVAMEDVLFARQLGDSQEVERGKICPQEKNPIDQKARPPTQFPGFQCFANLEKYAFVVSTSKQ